MLPALNAIKSKGWSGIEYLQYYTISLGVRFREGAGCGGWLRHTELMATPAQAGVVLGSALHANTHLHLQLLHTPGFTLLSW